MKSIISNEKMCLLCGTTRNIHKHHVFGGVANRPLSEKYGCWVYLCGFHHNLSDCGVHFDKSLDLEIKQLCQRRFEKDHSREEFMEIFGKSWL